MSTISRLQAALASATNEVVITAANINFDFSLVKCEAPKEYQPLGNMLAAIKKSNAETGTTHVTARRLGALFEGACPSTPALLKAYGTRASEISSAAKSAGLEEPEGSIFSAYAGVDGTSIWAAATSSKAALHVHLLACMLARMFDAAESVSIWVELVRERRRDIATRLEDGDAVPFSLTAAAAQNELSRLQLAEWDSSARSWLRTADEVKMHEYGQLRSLLKLGHLNVSERSEVFPSVMEAWASALNTIEGLISGQPQAAMDGSVLVALSSWHLYPNIAVFGTQNFEVVMNDDLISPAGVLSIGFSSTRRHGENGVFWCLSLAHLRHYGRPVRTERSFVPDPTRITFPQFLLCALGAITSRSQIPTKQLRQAMKYIASTSTAFRSIAPDADWPSVISRSASSYLSATGEEFETANRLIQYGRRRAKTFFAGEDRTATQNDYMLGPGNYVQLVDCLKNHEARISFLRRVVSNTLSGNTCDAEDFIILYRVDYGDVEISHASHHGRSSGEEGGGGNYAVDATLYTRNTSASRSGGMFALGADTDTEDDDEEEDCGLQFGCTTVVPGWSAFFSGMLEDTDSAKHHEGDVDRYHHLLPQGMTPPTGQQNECFHNVVPSGITLGRTLGHSTAYNLFCGDPNTAAVYCRKQIRLQPPAWDINHLFECLDNSDISYSRLFRQMGTNTSDSNNLASFSREIVQIYQALATAASIYKHLPDSSVAIQTLGKPIQRAKWYTFSTRLSDPSESKQYRRRLKRNLALAVAAYFDSGMCDLDPSVMDRVLAISSGDSIFVPRQVLCDPSERPKPRQLKRLLGNFGKPGVVLLTPPMEPMMRDMTRRPVLDTSISDFDGKQIDSLSRTSLHLTFTDHHVPVYDSNVGIGQDSQVSILEAFISVRDAGVWVADIDILKALDSNRVVRVPPSGQCEHDDQSIPSTTALSVDNWDDVLDCPEDKFVVRAHGNWLARLAVTAVLVQVLRDRNNAATVKICPSDICWQCLWKGTQSDDPLMQAYVH